MSKIDTLVQEFVVNLRAAIAEEAAAAFAAVATAGLSALTNDRAPLKPGRPPSGLTHSVKASASNGKRLRRSAADIEKQAGAILSFVKRNPGTNAEAIGKALGMTALQMQIPIAQLLSDKELLKKGERRGTTYSAR